MPVCQNLVARKKSQGFDLLYGAPGLDKEKGLKAPLFSAVVFVGSVQAMVSHTVIHESNQGL